jgi:hypothetical protein
MMKRLFTSCLMLLSLGSCPAQAQSYPETLEVVRADGMKIQLLRKVDGGTGEAYYLYGEPGYNVRCSGTTPSGDVPATKPQNMWNLSVILGLQDAKKINDLNRSSDMRDAAGNIYRVQLPSVDDLSALRQKQGGLPAAWKTICAANAAAFVPGGAEIWTASVSWSDHASLNLASGKTSTRADGEFWPVALKVLKVDSSQACLFEHGHYHGATRCFGAGEYRKLDDMDRKFSSLIVGQNCSVRLFADYDFRSRYWIYNAARKSAESWVWLDDMNDTARSMTVQCGGDSVVEDTEVCLFQHGDFTGNAACYPEGDVWFTEKYPDSTWANRSFSSMEVGKYCSVTLYEQFNYVGASVNYSARNSGKNLKVGWLGDFNDRTASLKVRCH